MDAPGLMTTSLIFTKDAFAPEKVILPENIPSPILIISIHSSVPS